MHLKIRNMKTFHIKFNRWDPVYMPGDEVRGYVYIDLRQKQNISGLKIMFLGRAVIKLPFATEDQEQTLVQRNNDIQIRKNEVEEYFRTEFYLLPQSNNVLHSLRMAEFPFVFVLPHNIPCSYEHEYGYIRYTVKAIIHRANKVDVEYKIPFTVFSIYDISTPPLTGNFRKIFRNHCCTRCYNKPLNLSFILHSITFMPGAPVTVNLISHDICELVIIEMKLEQCINFISKESNNMVRTATEFIMLPTIIKNYEKQKLDNLNSLWIKLIIPSLPPSKLQYCNIIDLRYNFHIIVSTEGHDNIDISFPVEVGVLGFVELTEHNFKFVSQDGMEPSIVNENIVLPKYIKRRNAGEAYIDDSGNFQYELGGWSSSSTCRRTTIEEEDDSKFIFGTEKRFSPIYPIYNWLNSILSL